MIKLRYLSGRCSLSPTNALAQFRLGRVYLAKSMYSKQPLDIKSSLSAPWKDADYKRLKIPPGAMLAVGNSRERREKENPGLLLMLLFLSTFDVHWRDWEALMRLIGLLRLGHKRQKMQVLRAM